MLRILFWGGVMYAFYRYYWKSGWWKIISPHDLKEYAIFCGVAVLGLVAYRKVTKQPLVW